MPELEQEAFNVFHQILPRSVTIQFVPADGVIELGALSIARMESNTVRFHRFSIQTTHRQ